MFPANTKAYRFVKLVSSPAGYVNAAEVQFYGGQTRLTGQAFGSTGSSLGEAFTFDKALDADTSTAFVAATAADAYVGYDLGSAQTQVAAPVLSVEPGAVASDTLTLTITTATPGASMRCTTDGSWPSPTRGTPCSGELTFNKSQTAGGRGKLPLRAIAYKPGLFDSAVTAANFYLNYTGTDVTSFHLGNSLTDTLNAHLAQISAAAGRDHTYHRCTVPGAPSEYLWTRADLGCIGVGSWPSVYENAARYGRLNHQSTQPSLGHGRSVDNEGDFTLRFLDAARKGGSTAVQHWIMGVWPTRDLDDQFSTARASLAAGDSYPYARANTFEQAALNHMAYVSSLAKWTNARIAGDPQTYGTKGVRVIPGSLAMYALLKDHYAGNVSAMQSEIYEDTSHLKPKGAYFISLLVYAALFGETPESKENTHHVSLGIATAEARVLQKLAWDVWQAYEANPAHWPNLPPSP